MSQWDKWYAANLESSNKTSEGVSAVRTRLGLIYYGETLAFDAIDKGYHPPVWRSRGEKYIDCFISFPELPLQIPWTETTKTCCLTVVGGRNLRPRCWQSDSFWELWRAICFMPSPNFWGVASSFWPCLAVDVLFQSLPSCSHGVLPVCMSMSKFPLFTRHPSYWIRRPPCSSRSPS